MNDITDTTTTFDADAFMTTQVDDAMATSLSTFEGEFTAMVGDFDSSAFKTVTTKNGPRAVLEIPFLLQDDALKAKLGREQLTHRETYWLDFVAGTSQLDTGEDKNVRLGQLRKVLDQNQKGVPWSPSMLRNMGPLKIAIKTTSDKNDPEKKYSNITKYAKIS